MNLPRRHHFRPLYLPHPSTPLPPSFVNRSAMALAAAASSSSTNAVSSRSFSSPGLGGSAAPRAVFSGFFWDGNGGALNLVCVAGVKLGAWRRVERVALPAEAGGRRTRVGVVMAAPAGRGESVVPQAATIVAPGNELFRIVAFWSCFGPKMLVLLGFW